MATPSERWRQIEALFAEVVELPAAERAALLDARIDDPTLRADLERLLAAHGRAGGFLDELDPARAAALVQSAEELTGEGEFIGPFRIVRRLGRGGMGIVYLAHDPRLDRPVALKLLPPWLSADTRAERRFIEEAKAASALDHPHIATVYEIGAAADERLYIAMAFYNGETLRDRIAHGPLPAADATELAIQIADGLAAAHRRGIVHRDIKPENLLVTTDGVVKIVDFGLAKMAGHALTRTGATLGTVAYMSPEQTRGAEMDHRTDLWSLGVVLYEMLAGVRPFRGDAEEAVVYGIRHDDPAPLETLRPEIALELAGVVRRCLAKDPAGRYASAATLLADLRAAARAGTGSVAMSEGRRMESPPGLRGLAAELKHRSVFRVAAVYATVAFVLLQAAGLIFPALLLPAWSFRLLTVLVILGFPLALVLAWAFELTPEGVRRAEPFTGAGGERTIPRWFAPSALAAAGVLGLGLLAFLILDRQSPTPSATASEAGAEAPSALPTRLAVLPLANYSPDTVDAYFADGMTEELISRLSRLGGLRVIARTSVMQYRDTEKTAAEIARELGVGTLLEGSVRKSGDRVRITLQLVDARSQEHLWSEDYDAVLDSVLTVQSEIAEQVADALQVRFRGDEQRRLTKQETTDPEAYELYLRGRYVWNQRTEAGLRKAVTYFREALAEDAGYAAAYVGLADAYRNLGSYGFLDSRAAYSRARAASVRAIELDPTLGQAHASLAGDLVAEREYVRAEDEFRKAIELEPSYAHAHHWYAFFLGIMDRREEALQAIRRAHELDPLSLPIMNTAVRLLIHAEQLDEAIQLGKVATELDPAFPWTHHALASAYVAQGRYDEADAAMVGALKQVPGEPRMRASLAAIRARAGDSRGARVLLEEFRSRAQDNSSPFAEALIHTALGQRDSAFRRLTRIPRNPEYLFSVRADPFLDPIRSDPRYDALLENLGLDATSR